MRFLLIVLIASLFVACGTDAAVDNLPPDVQVDVANQITHTVGDGVIRITVSAVDPERRGVQIGVSNPPTRAEFQTFDGFAIFSWDPLASDVTSQNGPLKIVFYAEDPSGARTEAVVYIEIVAGNGVPKFTNAASIIHPVQDNKPVSFEVKVRDDDSSQVMITMPADRAPAGATFSQLGDLSGNFEWVIPPEALQARVHSAVFIVTDGQNTVEQRVVIVLEKNRGGGTIAPDSACGFENIVTHTPLKNRNDSEDYPISVTLSGQASEYDRVVVTYGSGDVLNQFLPLQGFELVKENGVYSGSIPNPLLETGQTANMFYQICAIDDDAEELEDSAICGPSTGFYSFVAYAPGTEDCIDDMSRNNSFESAKPLTRENTDWLYGRTCDSRPDYYQVEVGASDDLTVAVYHSPNSNVTMEVYDSNRNVINNADIRTSDCGSFTIFNRSNSSQFTQSLFIRVNGDGAPYQLYSSFVAPCFGDENEPNDTDVDGTPLGNVTNQDGEICPSGDRDVYLIEASAGQLIDVLIEFDGDAGGDLDIRLHNDPANIGTYTGTVAKSTTVGNDDGFVYQAETSATYYLEVFGFGHPNDYTMTSSVETPTCDDNEPANNHSPATSVVQPQGKTEGHIVCPGVADWYNFQAFGNEVLEFHTEVLTGDEFGVEMNIYRGIQLIGIGTSAGFGSVSATINFSTTDTYHIEVKSDNPVTYDLQLLVPI